MHNLENTGGATKNLENTGGATKLGKYWWSNKTQKILVEQQNLENTGGATKL